MSGDSLPILFFVGIMLFVIFTVSHSVYKSYKDKQKIQKLFESLSLTDGLEKLTEDDPKRKELSSKIEYMHSIFSPYTATPGIGPALLKNEGGLKIYLLDIPTFLSKGRKKGQTGSSHTAIFIEANLNIERTYVVRKKFPSFIEMTYQNVEKKGDPLRDLEKDFTESFVSYASGTGEETSPITSSLQRYILHSSNSYPFGPKFTDMCVIFIGNKGICILAARKTEKELFHKFLSFGKGLFDELKKSLPSSSVSELPVSTVKTCPSCSMEVDENLRFCTGCGASI